MKNLLQYPISHIALILVCSFILPDVANGNFVHKCDENPDGIYYIIAPSGLNFRKTSNPRSEKIGHIPYGEPIELIAPSFDISLEVDQIAGGMAEIYYKGEKGFVFDGYISRFPAAKGIETDNFVEKVRDLGYEVLFEEHRLDWGGYIKLETAFTLPGLEWSEAFLIAKQHFNIPEGLLFPNSTGEPYKKEKVANPNREEEVWEDSMTAFYDKNGQLAAIEYAMRREGFGQAITIAYSEEISGIRIAEIGIAD